MFLYVSAQESSEEISLKTLEYVDKNKAAIYKHFGAPIMAKVVSSDNLDEVKLLGITALPALYHEKQIIDGCDEIINFFKETFSAAEPPKQKKRMTSAPVEEFDIKETMSRMADSHIEGGDDEAPDASELNNKYQAAIKMRKIAAAPQRPGQDSHASEDRTSAPSSAPQRDSSPREPPKLPKAPIIPEDNDDQLMLDKFYSDI